MTSAEIQARLTLIDARLDELYGSSVQSLSIGDRNATLRDIEQLERMRDKYAQMLTDVDGVRPYTVRYQTPI